MNRGSVRHLVLLAIHVAMAPVVTFIPSSLAGVALAVMIIGIIKILKSSNRDELAARVAAYIVGMEILLRMSKCGLPFEFGKYAASIVLIVGFISDKHRRKVIVWPYVYFMLLLPSVLLTIQVVDFERSRQLIVANLSGPFATFVAIVYFYNRLISRKLLNQICNAALLPVITLCVYLFLNAESAEDVDFINASNFSTTIYGANQVSISLGFSILLISLSLLRGDPLFRPVFINFAVIAVCLFRGLLSFSRGGMVVPAVAIIIGTLYQTVSLQDRNKLKTLVLIFFASFPICIVGYLVFQRVDGITQGALSTRYLSFLESDSTKENKYLSSRDRIMRADIEIFFDNPIIGIGPGMAVTERLKYGFPVKAAAHTEQSRVLAEHGILGASSFMILMLGSYGRFRHVPRSQRGWYLSLFLFSFLTIAHSAIRLAIPAYVMGLYFASFQLWSDLDRPKTHSDGF